MDRKIALGLLLATAIILAVLLITSIVTPLTGVIIFAVALVLFGTLSQGYRKGN